MAFSRELADRQAWPEAVYWAKRACLLWLAQAPRPDAAADEVAPWLQAMQVQVRHLGVLLARSQRTAEALQLPQRLKEWELWADLGLGERPSGADLYLNDAEQALIRVHAELAEKEDELARERERLQSRPDARSEQSQEALGRNAAQAQLLRSEASTAFAESRQHLRNEARQPPRLPPSRLQQALRQRADQEGAGAEAAIGIQYVPVTDGLWCWVFLEDQQVRRVFVSIQSEEFEDAVIRLNLLIRSSQSHLPNVHKAAQALYRVLLLPVEPWLKEGRTLVISASGCLRQVPFAALHDGSRYSIERWQFASFNDAAPCRSTRSERATNWRVLAMGATRPVAGLPALTGVREETSAAVRQSRSTGEVYLDQRFNAANLRQALGDHQGGGLRVLHLASHYVMSPRSPRDSRLYLGDGSSLSLQELASGQWALDDIDLLTLSACETAAAMSVSDRPTGRELESLAAAAQMRGARSVLATLWRINDRSTAALMRRFYAERNDQGGSKAASLRAAQSAFATAPESGAPAAAWRHPFYWAAFVLMGDWS